MIRKLIIEQKLDVHARVSTNMAINSKINDWIGYKKVKDCTCTECQLPTFPMHDYNTESKFATTNDKTTRSKVQNNAKFVRSCTLHRTYANFQICRKSKNEQTELVIPFMYSDGKPNDTQVVYSLSLIHISEPTRPY